LRSPDRERNFETFHSYENNGAATTTVADEFNRKKSINDILHNFKREKEQFNEKLSQLKTKLEQVKSPEPSQYRSSKGFQQDGSDVPSSPGESRRSKTIQKIKNVFNKERDDGGRVNAYKMSFNK
jgi:hypothetical protein